MDQLESCANCVYGKKVGDSVCCMDYDGLYFMWKRSLDRHCPDYQAGEYQEENKLVEASGF